MTIRAGRPAAPPPVRAAPRAAAPPLPPAPSTFHDAGPSGNYGTPSATHYKASPAYHQAVVQVFKAQPKPVQARIVQHAQRSPSVEGHAVLNYLKQTAAASNPMLYGIQHQGGPSVAGAGPGELRSLFPGSRSPGLDVGKILGDLGHMLNPATVFGGGGQPGSAGKISGGSLPGIGTLLPFGGGKGAETIAENTGKDLWNLPAGTVEGLYGLGKDLEQRHFGNAFHMLVDPYVQAFQNPTKAFYGHPLNTALLFAGPEAAVGRGAGAAMRSGIFRDAGKAAASTAREPLALGTVGGTEAPIFEERNYSPNVLHRAMQRSREKYLQSRGINPNVSRPAPGFLHPVLQQAFNVGTEAKLRRIADEMTAVSGQMAGREERGRVLNTLRASAPSKAARNVVGHVLQGVIRKPETAVEDATKEINRLKAAQTGKRTIGEIFNRRQVRDLSTALKTPGALAEAFKSAEQIRPLLHSQDAYLVAHGLLDAEQAGRSKLFPYAQAHMGARYDHQAGALVHADGSPLSTDELLNHVKDNKVPDPAFVGHFPGKVNPARFYSAYKLARGSFGNKQRTGEAFRSGAYDHTFEGLAGQVASRAQTVTKASLHDKIINRLGIGRPEAMLSAKEKAQLTEIRKLLQNPGHLSPERLDALRERQHELLSFTPEEGRRFARAAMVDDHGNPIPNALELTPVAKAPASSLSLIRDLQHPSELRDIPDLELRALSNAVEHTAGRTDGKRNVVLVPSAATQRFADQYERTGKTLRNVGKVTQQFRRTVLPYSTHWMTQIGSEAGLRALLGGVLDPRYLADGRRLMHQLEKTDAGRNALREMVNGTFYGSGGASNVLDALRGRGVRAPMDIHNPNPGMVARAAKTLPPTRQLIAAHNRYADAVNAAMYGLEHNARVMGLGKLAHKEVQSFGFSWQNAVRLEGQAIAHLAGRLESNPALVAKFGRQIDATFGKYNKFSPAVRSAIQSYAPFLPWYLNAARYVLWHLPAHHPVATSLLASLRQTINQDIQDGKQAPLNAYSMQELARISPFGIFTPPSTKPSTGAAIAGQQATGAFLPQIEGSYLNLTGTNSFGDGPLKGPGGDIKANTGPATAAAIENLLESFLPGVRYARLAQEKGKPAYGTSTVLSPQTKAEKGTSVLNRVFNPFYSFERAGTSGPAYGAAASSAAGGGSGAAGGGYSVAFPGEGGASGVESGAQVAIP